MTAKPAAKHDWWLYAVLALALLQVALFLVLRTRPGKLGVVLWSVGPAGLGFLAVALLIIAVAWSAVRRPFWTSRRGIGYVALAFILTVSAKAYRVYPSSHDDAPSQVEFRLPLDGPVTVAWGGATMDVNYHVRAPDQRWAYDLLVTKDGRSSSGSGGHLEDYYAFGLPVLAPAAGTVHSILDGKPDQPIGTKWIGKDWAGNHVVLDIAPGEFLFIAHLEAATLTVEPGDRVQAGQELGRVGNSGRTTEPHVHVHLQDTPQLHVGEKPHTLPTAPGTSLPNFFDHNGEIRSKRRDSANRRPNR